MMRTISLQTRSKMKLLLNSFLLVLASPLIANEITNNKFKCPKEAVLIDFKDPRTEERTVFCQIRKDGKLLKHGVVLTINKSGKIIKQERFNEGISEKSGKLDKGVIVDKAIKNE